MILTVIIWYLAWPLQGLRREHRTQVLREGEDWKWSVLDNMVWVLCICIVGWLLFLARAVRHPNCRSEISQIKNKNMDTNLHKYK